MKLLICASARAEIVMKCLREFEQENDITIAAPSGVGRALKESEDIGNAALLQLSSPSFCDESRVELRPLMNERFDAVVIVSGGLSFERFDNVIGAIAGLHVNDMLIFYNSVGHREIVQVSNGITRMVERHAIELLCGFWRMIRPVELFAERIYIQCAELLGL